MIAITAGQMREIDRRCVAEFGVAGAALMDRAGQGVADTVRRLAERSATPIRSACLYAGTGNNGGDACVAARYLRGWGIDAQLLLAGTSDRLQGDARDAFRAMREAGVPVHELPAATDWDAYPAPGPSSAIVVDGLLGTGARGVPRDAVAAAIRHLNAAGAHNAVVAIDLPSGLDADTGLAEGDVVVADVTVTMGFPKHGLLAPSAIELVGSVDVVDIGIPPSLRNTPRGDVEMLTCQDVCALLPRRPRQSHKGRFGHALLVGGAAGYAGAIAMAARAALRGGAGLVSVLVPRSVAATVAELVPEAMVHAAPETEHGSIAGDAMGRWGRALGDFQAVLAGPGMTACPATEHTVMSLLRGAGGTLVLDADALNVLARRADVLRLVAGRLVITPHPGEMSRLLGMPTADVQRDRRAAVAAAVDQTHGVVVLKGAGTLIASRTPPLWINLNGNPGMATGGMGDVLAGLITGMAAAGLEPLDAARLAVYVHGRAGDLAAQAGTQHGLTASDLLAQVPPAVRELAGR